MGAPSVEDIPVTLEIKRVGKQLRVLGVSGVRVADDHSFPSPRTVGMRRFEVPCLMGADLLQRPVGRS